MRGCVLRPWVVVCGLVAIFLFLPAVGLFKLWHVPAQEKVLLEEVDYATLLDACQVAIRELPHGVSIQHGDEAYAKLPDAIRVLSPHMVILRPESADVIFVSGVWEYGFCALMDIRGRKRRQELVPGLWYFREKTRR